jgi:hypothetical protein
MQTIPLTDLIYLQSAPTSNAAFLIGVHKSTFTFQSVDDARWPNEKALWACPTELCGENSEQYNPGFIMAVLTVTQLSSNPELLNQVQLPKVLFPTQSDIRRSMMLNSMCMSSEFLDSGSERIFEITRHRLEKMQTDIIHDHLAYLMYAILDARREYAQEASLRAESIAAYLGIVPSKVLLLIHQHGHDVVGLTASLEEGLAGTLHRKIDTSALINNQIELLLPFRQHAYEKESSITQFIAKIVELWKDC